MPRRELLVVIDTAARRVLVYDNTPAAFEAVAAWSADVDETGATRPGLEAWMRAREIRAYTTAQLWDL
jgi:hypothetical protein